MDVTFHSVFADTPSTTSGGQAAADFSILKKWQYTITAYRENGLFTINLNAVSLQLT
jgi:hypothetical protein